MGKKGGQARVVSRVFSLVDGWSGLFGGLVWLVKG